MSHSKSELDGAVAKLTAMQPGDSAHETYQAWAPNYEADLIGNYGYQAHTIAAEALSQHIDVRTASIADLGCGTGLVAVALEALGSTCVDGFDASDNMLAIARDKRCYRELVKVDLTDPESMPSAQYDAAIAVGVFGAGHVGPAHLACFFQPVKSGGFVVLYANGIPFVEDNYPAHLKQLEADGVCRVEYSEESNYMDKIERPGWLVVATRA